MCGTHHAKPIETRWLRFRRLCRTSCVSKKETKYDSSFEVHCLRIDFTIQRHSNSESGNEGRDFIL